MVGLIAHEWVAPRGGSENVAEALAAVYPTADVVTLWNDAPDRFAQRSVSETWLSRTPLRRSKALALPLMSPTWSVINTERYDFALVSSHVFAHHLGDFRKRSRSTPKFVYVHTPARTIWAPEQDSRGAGTVVRAAASVFRAIDRSHADARVDYAANSRFIQRRVAQAWGQQATVIYPPVDVETIRTGTRSLNPEDEAILDALPATFVLGASRFVPYKRLDLVLQAADASRQPVVIAGAGPEEQRLRSLARSLTVPVVFVHSPSVALLHELYRRAAVFVFPAVEDFGIMPVEAMAAGTPVVVSAEGGARESVDMVGGGVVAATASISSFASGIRAVLAGDPRFSLAEVESRFGQRRFEREVRAWVGPVGRTASKDLDS